MVAFGRPPKTTDHDPVWAAFGRPPLMKVLKKGGGEMASGMQKMELGRIIQGPVPGWREAPGAVRARTPRATGPNICIDDVYRRDVHTNEYLYVNIDGN